MTSTCPSCHEPASGRFCSSCGTALAGATCATCSAPLTPGARFCHRCGTPAGSTSAPARGLAGVLPWAVAAIALVSLIALVVGVSVAIKAYWGHISEFFARRKKEKSER